MDNADRHVSNAPGKSDHAGRSRVEPDHFITEDGATFAGRHLLADLWQARGLEDMDKADQALRDAAAAAGASVLHVHVHRFATGGGISGVAVLAESHISIHTWPQRGFVALDIFMCGDTAPQKALDIFKDAFRPGRVEVRDLRRGPVG